MSASASGRSSNAQVRSAPSCSNMKSQCVARGEPGGISWRKTTKRGMREILLFHVDRGLMLHDLLLRHAIALQHGLQRGFPSLLGLSPNSERHGVSGRQFVDWLEPHELLFWAIELIRGSLAHRPQRRAR